MITFIILFEEWSDDRLDHPEVTKMLESFRWVRCSFTYFPIPATHFLHSLRASIAHWFPVGVPVFISRGHFLALLNNPKVCISEVWVTLPRRSKALQPWTCWGQFHKLWQWSAGRLSWNQVLPKRSRIWSTNVSLNSTNLPQSSGIGSIRPERRSFTIWSLPNPKIVKKM